MAATWRMKPVVSALAVLAIAFLSLETLAVEASEAKMGTGEHGINLPDGLDATDRAGEDNVVGKEVGGGPGICGERKLQEATASSVPQVRQAAATSSSDSEPEAPEGLGGGPPNSSGESASGESRSNLTEAAAEDESSCWRRVEDRSRNSSGAEFSEELARGEGGAVVLENHRPSSVGPNDRVPETRAAAATTTSDHPTPAGPTAPPTQQPLGVTDEDQRSPVRNSINQPSPRSPGERSNKTLNAFRVTKSNEPRVPGQDGPGATAPTFQRKVIPEAKQPHPGDGSDNSSTEAQQLLAKGPAKGPSNPVQDAAGGGGAPRSPARPAEASRKDSRSMSNLLLGSSKSAKAFYEIRPSIRSEMENRLEALPVGSTQLSPRKFILPNVDSSFGKFGPYFEDGDTEINITARIGSTVLLDCKIGMLADKQVTWLQHNKDSFRLLTVGRTPYSLDQRISLNFRYPSNWRLQILYASPRDSGLYKCQVATHPPLVKKINVVVTAPTLTITDDFGRVVPKERHLKAGSALKLRCEARDVLESQNESVVWTRGDETLVEDVSENRTTEVSSGMEILVIVSTLIVEKATPRHAGNYSCVVPGKAKTTITVHVLNGELPAAVHDGSGVSRAVLNLWLIHLTVSYVFSR